MNTKHLEFFKNSYYKWVNERYLDIAQVYLFIFQSLYCIDIRPFKVTYLVSIHVATIITFWSMGSYLMTLYFCEVTFVKRLTTEGHSCVCIVPMVNFLKLRNILHRVQRKSLELAGKAWIENICYPVTLIKIFTLCLWLINLDAIWSYTVIIIMPIINTRCHMVYTVNLILVNASIKIHLILTKFY